MVPLLYMQTEEMFCLMEFCRSFDSMMVDDLAKLETVSTGLAHYNGFCRGFLTVFEKHTELRREVRELVEAILGAYDWDHLTHHSVRQLVESGLGMAVNALGNSSGKRLIRTCVADCMKEMGIHS